MHLSSKDCEEYYCRQVGGSYFQGQTAYQRGGGFFGDIKRYITPLAVRAGKYLGKQLLRTGQGVLTDVAGGRSFKESARSRVGETSKRIKDDIIHRLQHGKGIKRKRKRQSVQTQKKRRKTGIDDIFT